MHERYHEGEALHSENDVEANSAHTRLNPAARIGVIHSFPLALQNLVKKTVIVMLIQSIFCVLASFAGYAIFAIVFFLLILIGLWGVLSFRKAPTIAYVLSCAVMSGLFSAETCYVIKDDYDCQECILASIIITLMFFMGLHYSYMILNIIRLRETFPHMKQVSKEFIIMTTTPPATHY
eukprot:TRINITY_DN5534_c0_g1_i1.p1 TRINITY_DN5534_c0_g1~~TRINITY_DN5534_c0_g1_i1.p1  ORF type:complete len:179 (+),score=31.95 TRINITY_DN5534_c0_g1_i1:55-591(+)